MVGSGLMFHKLEEPKLKWLKKEMKDDTEWYNLWTWDEMKTWQANPSSDCSDLLNLRARMPAKRKMQCSWQTLKAKCQVLGLNFGPLDLTSLWQFIRLNLYIYIYIYIYLYIYILYYRSFRLSIPFAFDLTFSFAVFPEVKLRNPFPSLTTAW